MHTRTVALAFAWFVLPLSGAGCRDASSATSVDTTEKPAPITPHPPPTPALRATIYRRPSYPSIRYVLYENDTFDLEYGSGWPTYSGTFTRTTSIIALTFAWTKPDWCKQAWCEKMEASADVRGDTLRVNYDAGSAWLLCADMMDFDACANRPSTYIRSQ